MSPENFQKPNSIPNVALAQTQSQKNAQPQEQKPAEQKEKKELSPRAKLLKDLNALVTKLKSIDKREDRAKNALTKIEEERAEVEALAKKFELSNSASV
jgi:hypothetical protein|nr:hypothetical protein [uncultured Campylobacter sp.]